MLFGSLLFQEKAITPGEGFLFPCTDWLIGNHSDELTPWIPVLAARRVISRYNLTQQLKCQLITPIGNHIMGRGRMCEYVCVFVPVSQLTNVPSLRQPPDGDVEPQSESYFSLMWPQMIISSNGLLFPA